MFEIKKLTSGVPAAGAAGPGVAADMWNVVGVDLAVFGSGHVLPAVPVYVELGGRLSDHTSPSFVRYGQSLVCQLPALYR